MPDLRRTKLGRYLVKKRNGIRFRRAGRDLRIEFNNPSIGMFAQLNVCLHLARYAQHTGQQLHIDLTSDNYRDPAHGPNWLEYFFVQIKESVNLPERPCAVLSWPFQIPRLLGEMTLESAHDIFFTTFDIHPDIAANVDRVAQRLAIGPRTIGVHFRATDKHLEADLVEMAHAIDRIEAVVFARPATTNVFVTSDDARFPPMLRSRLPDFSVVYLEDSRRSSGENPIHLGGLQAGNYEMGRDAILNALTLARCGALVRTTSFLSAWSSVFNPAVEVMLLNQPRPDKLWFPESVIIPRATVL